MKTLYQTVVSEDLSNSLGDDIATLRPTDQAAFD